MNRNLLHRMKLKKNKYKRFLFRIYFNTNFIHNMIFYVAFKLHKWEVLKEKKEKKLKNYYGYYNTKAQRLKMRVKTHYIVSK